jgi:predicted RNA-binding Zn-ribbon protein involved in translation (DUF1610 family)
MSKPFKCQKCGADVPTSELIAAATCPQCKAQYTRRAPVLKLFGEIIDPGLTGMGVVISLND